MASLEHIILVIKTIMFVTINTTENNVCQCIGQKIAEYHPRSIKVSRTTLEFLGGFSFYQSIAEETIPIYSVVEISFLLPLYIQNKLTVQNSPANRAEPSMFSAYRLEYNKDALVVKMRNSAYLIQLGDECCELFWCKLAMNYDKTCICILKCFCYNAICFVKADKSLCSVFDPQKSAVRHFF